MAKKQIIGSILIFFALLELFALEMHRSYYELHIYGFTEEMFYFFAGAFVFLMLLVIGTLILRKGKLIYWNVSWATTSVFVGILSLWVFILAKNPTESGWGALAQAGSYYIIGSLQNQTAVLALRTSHELRRKFLSIFTWFSLAFSSAILILYIGSMVSIFIHEKSIWGLPLYGFLLDTIPLSVTTPIILFVLKEKSVKKERMNKLS